MTVVLKLLKPRPVLYESASYVRQSSGVERCRFVCGFPLEGHAHHSPGQAKLFFWTPIFWDEKDCLTKNSFVKHFLLSIL